MNRKLGKDNHMKHMLHIVGSMSPGGYENFIMNIYRSMNLNKLQFAFVVHMHKNNSYDDEIVRMGGKVHYATRKSINPVKNFIEIVKIVRNNRYDTVCRHSDNAFAIIDLLAARLGGAKRVIMHSHSTDSSRKFLHRFTRLFMGMIPTHRWACSEEAAKWMYGERSYKKIPNAIDTRLYSYNEELRHNKRLEWGLDGCHVIGHVGNYQYAKNHPYLISIFAEIVKLDDKARLMLIGGGDGQIGIEELIRSKGISDKVIVCGSRSDVNELLQVFDIFLFPSIYEGYPVSLLEAQCSGVECVISDRITKEVDITSLIHRLSIDEEPKKWARMIVSLLSMEDKEKPMQLGNGGSNELGELEERGRRSRAGEIIDAHYGIDELVHYYEDF